MVNELATVTCETSSTVIGAQTKALDTDPSSLDIHDKEDREEQVLLWSSGPMMAKSPWARR